MSVIYRYAAVRKQRLCYGGLGKVHAKKDCKVKAFGINWCIKKHNWLLHSENQIEEGNHAVNVSAGTNNQMKQSDEVTSFLQMVPVSIQRGGNKLNTYAFLDSGSTFSIIKQNVQEKLRAQGTALMVNIAGIHGQKTKKRYGDRKCSFQSKGTTFKDAFNWSVCTTVYLFGKQNYYNNKLMQSFNHLSVLRNKSFRLMEVGIILGQDAYELQGPLDYKIGTPSRPLTVLTGLGWVVSGPITGKRSHNVCHFTFTEDLKLDEWEYPNLVRSRNLRFQNQRRQSVK